MKTVLNQSGRTMNSMLQATDKAVVLVIDDDPEAIAGLAEVLSAAGYISQCCHDAEGAIECVRQSTPDLIIADINISGHSGIQLCERIKRDEGLADVPAMFLSRTQVPDIIRRSQQAGGSYFLRKPFDPQVLLELVDKALWMPQLVGGHAAG
jgi:CheY-like chemotaxis protein